MISVDFVYSSQITLTPDLSDSTLSIDAQSSLFDQRYRLTESLPLYSSADVYQIVRCLDKHIANIA